MRRAVLMIGLFLVLGDAGLSQAEIRGVDFENFAYPWSPSFDRGLASVSQWRWLDPASPKTNLALKDGFLDFGQFAGYLKVQSVTYGDVDGDGLEDAAIDLLRGSGGSANWHYLYVYKGAPQAPVLLGILRSGSRAYGGLTGVQIAGGVLVLEFNDEVYRQGDCCSAGFVQVRYVYRNKRFVEVAPRVRGLRPE